MCKAALILHPKREPIGAYHGELRVMRFEGRLIPITAHVDEMGIFDYIPWQVPLIAEGQDKAALKANVLALIDKALEAGILPAEEPCKMAAKAVA